MTKAKAIKLMREYSRLVIDPALALKIAQAFGYKLSDLGIKPQKVESFSRLNYSEETSHLSAVAVYRLAKELASKKGVEVSSGMHGTGSYADDITEKATKVLEEVK